MERGMYLWEALNSLDISTVLLFISVFVILFAPFLWQIFLFNSPVPMILPADPPPPSEISRIRAAKPVTPGTTPPFPNGWYHLMYSDELPHQGNKIIKTEVAGQKVAVWRDENGVAVAVDTLCPHLGADLSEGSIVTLLDSDGKEKRCISCPFHGWTFDSQGACVYIPYHEPTLKDKSGKCKKPAEESEFTVDAGSNYTYNRATSAKKKKLCEINSVIYLWYHANDSPPSWEIPPLSSTSLWHYGRATTYVHCFLQELPENAADLAHLPTVHTGMVVPLLDLLGFKHQWSTCFVPNQEKDNRHRAKCIMKQCVTWCGIVAPLSMVQVEVNMIGPALVHLKFGTFAGTVMATQHISPIHPDLQRVEHNVYGTALWSPFPSFGKLFLLSILTMFNRDLPIWNAKAFVSRPVVVNGDGPINEFRRWMKQFYSLTHIPLAQTEN